MTPRARFDTVDLALFALGVVGLALFVWLLPGQHPDSAASYALGREEAVARARDVLERQGYPTDDLTPTARLTRSPRLLDSLQVSLGRPAMIRMLREGGGEDLPAYHWNVQWRRPSSASSSGPPDFGPMRLAYDVYLTQRGEPWQFLNPHGTIPRAGVDREVLRTLLEADPEMGDRLVTPPDSSLGALLYFDLSSASRLADSTALLRADWERLNDAATTGQPQGLGEAAAAMIARAHLAPTALGALPMDVTSVEALPERGRSAARVRFASARPVHGQRVEADVDVTAAGALLQLDARFNAEEVADRVAAAGDDEGSSVVIGFSGSDDTTRTSVKLIGYIAILLVLIVVLFRRLSARALDARAALKDALLAGFLAFVSLGVAAPTLIAEIGTGWNLVVALGFVMVFVGAGVGLLAFIASATSDALAREAWPQQITTLSLARQAAWLNQPVGRALLRGAATAGVLLGAAVLALAAFPQGTVGFGDNVYLSTEQSFSIFATAVTQGGWGALLLVLAVFVGVGSLWKRWRAEAVVPGLAVVLAAVGIDAVALPVGSGWVTWGVPLVLGLVLGALYRRYDALTLLVAVVLTGVLWDTAEGWLVAASPARIDALLGGAFYAGVLALGFVGVRSGRTGEHLPSYVPDYVVEQRERGRLQRELEIAREVQRSFLPAQMPTVPGLDLAARCLAAEEVGGDYYDAIRLDADRLALVIGDVSGKGIQAAFFMTLVKGFLQTLAYETDSPAEVLRRANRLFFANAPRGTFISLIYGIFDLRARTFTFARAGHNPLILKRSPHQTAEFVRPAGLAIGLTARSVFDETIEEQTIPLHPGDTFVLYTDGFSESMDRAKTLYTDERLAEHVAAANAHADAAALLQSMIDDVLRHAGDAGQHDDMTMVVVKVAIPASDESPPVLASLAAP